MKMTLLQNLKFVIPNFFSFFNLVFGALVILYSFQLNFKAVLVFYFGAVLSDFLDGFFARKLNAQSAFGKLFDTFSDAVSFGFGTSIIIFFQLNSILSKEFTFCLSFLYLISCLVRLKKYLDSNNTQNFNGLPSPISGFMILISFFIFSNIYPFLIFHICVLTALLNANVEYIHLKNIKNKSLYLKLLALGYLLSITIHLTLIPLDLLKIVLSLLWFSILIYIASPLYKWIPKQV